MTVRLFMSLDNRSCINTHRCQGSVSECLLRIVEDHHIVYVGDYPTLGNECLPTFLRSYTSRIGVKHPSLDSKVTSGYPEDKCVRNKLKGLWERDLPR